MEKQLPSELSEIMKELPEDSKLISLDFWSMGWIAFLETTNRQFKLVSDRGYIDTYEIAEGKAQFILPPESQRLFISSAQIALLIKEAVVIKNGKA
ncbi:MAG: hypothetical protein IPP66_10790 [Anaerolineales bacterium]|nr:hypothetical protein [Anaerolineales bacterium]